MATPASSSPGRARLPIGRIAYVLAAIVLSSGIGYAVANASTPSAARPSLIRAEVITDFNHLVGPPESAERLTPYVDAVNAALANAIGAGAVQSPSDDSNLTPDGTVSVSTIRVVSPEVATVDFGISDDGGGGFVQPFVGDVVATGGRWKISWATVCMLVESESYVCPNPPTTLLGAVPRPHSLAGQASAAAEEPDVIRPQALAAEENGDLLIVDSDRDQILRWRPDGQLSVFAGTGQPGLAGVGGPAIDARLPDLVGSQLAVARNGTVYVTGGNACGVLKIMSSGLLERELPKLCNVSGVAISTAEILYVTNGSSVYRVAASGALTMLARSANSGPQPGATTPNVPTGVGFWPSLLAFQGNGDLDIYSSGPRGIWRLTPSGELSDISADYVNGMAATPGGSVLLAGHGGSIDRVGTSGIVADVDLLSTKIVGYGVPGMRGGFQPDGIAVAPSGAIFVDTFSGNGWTDATSIAEIPPGGEPHQIAVTTPMISTLPGADAPDFPAADYPAPRPAQGNDLSSCPSPRGLEPFDAAALVAMRQTAARFNAYVSSFWGDLQSSDRSWWSGVVGDWTGGNYDNDTHTVVSVGPASADTFAPAISSACGEALLRDSEVVVEGPSPYSFQVTHLFFLDRDGRPLVYFQAS